jgi:UbiD family decarboxylase
MVSFKQALQILEEKGKLKRVTDKTSLDDIPEIIRNAENALIFENTETKYQLASNICTRDNFCAIFGMNWKQIQEKLITALNNPIKPITVDENSFEEAELDLRKLPILKYYRSDPGPYITSGVFVTECEERNLSYHRILVKNKNTGTTRICHRHTWQCYNKSNKQIDVAICIGMDPALLFAGAISTKEPMDETEIAGGFYGKPIKLVKLENGISVPADTEFVLLGKLTSKLGEEGPFVDITGTYDLVRQQPIVKINKILIQKKNPIYYALIPGRGEHSFLMGFGKLPLIYKELRKVSDIKNLAFTDGEINWLSCSVTIKKRSDKEPKKVIETTLEAHRSLKHVFVFDEDINLTDPQDMQWALTTRFQADKDLYTYPDSPGSSLDPSSEPGEDRRKTCKAGFDCTIPLSKDKKDFEKVL